MPEVLFTHDPDRPMAEQRVPGHNRWHPEIPAAATARSGQEFRVECREWTDGQIGNNDSANDVRDVNLNGCHVLSGPIAVEEAQPGDLLMVDILDLGPIPQQTGPVCGQGWGYSGIFAKVNGGGFLTDYFPDAYKAVWDFHGHEATSRHIPGVRYTGITHPGLMGVAPSSDLLSSWNTRERALIATDPDRVPPLALPPLPDGTLAGQAGDAAAQRVATEGARTVPPRENGGNHDIKNFTRGSRVFYPVHVPGALLSMGDLHFSQGDGEINFCGAIEMAGYIDLRVEVIKNGMETYGVHRNPMFIPGRMEPRYSEFLTFIGVSVDHRDNTNLYMDATEAYRNACLNAIEYLKKWGYTGEQAYFILGTAPIEGRISGVVDIPNACCSLYLPTEIFDFDIRPGGPGPVATDRGQVCVTS
ncbi:acetamidase/formamidase family protein [Lipingzhangella sp. LS1_29]|uniref:Acetamidase/formamidase family protein n=1 Tax=Lipingzhangella rawalii TaxID=2055835 RepID=A0ABU2H491_9ACTN|nr:formamidase [Lipingzhangella rawalii]MDS1270115.1 acetamidase/formamidase family protein [Lipingzhangella rawalii]